jgi:U4/U6.U5 tri-snRNP-associated protein 1
MSHEESISLEETNKHRIALGLKPLTDDKAPVDSAEKRAEDNYAKQREKEVQEREKKYVCSPPNPTSSLTCGLFRLSGGSRIK